MWGRGCWGADAIDCKIGLLATAPTLSPLNFGRHSRMLMMILLLNLLGWLIICSGITQKSFSIWTASAFCSGTCSFSHFASLIC